jgi:hypothetical protein
MGTIRTSSQLLAERPTTVEGQDLLRPAKRGTGDGRNGGGSLNTSIL